LESVRHDCQCRVKAAGHGFLLRADGIAENMLAGIGELGAHEKNQQIVDYYSTEKQINSNTPPTLLLLSDDDKVVVPENSILFYQGLKQKNISASMHIFPVGGHGWGFNVNFRYHEQMKALVLGWLEQMN
jgi:dipeptidyl aminopeptidase/acylaminoacyl peptidase